MEVVIVKVILTGGSQSVFTCQPLKYWVEWSRTTKNWVENHLPAVSLCIVPCCRSRSLRTLSPPNTNLFHLNTQSCLHSKEIYVMWNNALKPCTIQWFVINLVSIFLNTTILDQFSIHFVCEKFCFNIWRRLSNFLVIVFSFLLPSSSPPITFNLSSSSNTRNSLYLFIMQIIFKHGTFII